MNEVMPRLAEKLIENCFDGVVFFANSGAEANEGMFKLARKIGNASGRNEIISMDNSFHGGPLPHWPPPGARNTARASNRICRVSGRCRSTISKR